jgi:GDP-L-fucose synthase
MIENSLIHLAGHNGMVGSAIWRTLTVKGYTNLIVVSSRDLDLRNQKPFVILKK